MNSEIERWRNDPVTKKYMKVLQEHRDAHLDRMLNCGVITQDKLPELAQLKGQINTIDLMMSTEGLEDLLEGEL